MKKLLFFSAIELLFMKVCAEAKIPSGCSVITVTKGGKFSGRKAGGEQQMILPLSPWIVLTWWALTAAGAVLGGILVYPYELWCVNKGCIAWSILAGDKGQLASPGLKKTWWWILAGLVLLIAGMAAGIILLKATSGT